MKICIRKYREKDFEALDRCLVELQDFLVPIDPLSRLRRAPDYSPHYALHALAKVKKHNGVIFLACDELKIVGCVVAIVEQQSKKNLLELVPTVAGRIVELFVSSDYRGFGIGERLMKRAEIYLWKKKCDVIRIEVFAPNQAAHDFYKKVGYQDRVIDMIKVL